MTLKILPPGAITPGTYKTFTDKTLADLVANADPDEEPAEAQFAMGMNYAQVDGRITSVDLEVRLTIDMPEWSELSNRPAAEKTEWVRFMKALRYHEDGHIAIFRREAAVTYNRLVASTAAKIDDVLKNEKKRIQGLSDVYDVNTGNGRKQKSPHGTTVITVP